MTEDKPRHWCVIHSARTSKTGFTRIKIHYITDSGKPSLMARFAARPNTPATIFLPGSILNCGHTHTHTQPAVRLEQQSTGKSQAIPGSGKGPMTKECSRTMSYSTPETMKPIAGLSERNRCSLRTSKNLLTSVTHTRPEHTKRMGGKNHTEVSKVLFPTFDCRGTQHTLTHNAHTHGRRQTVQIGIVNTYTSAHTQNPTKHQSPCLADNFKMNVFTEYFRCRLTQNAKATGKFLKDDHPHNQNGSARGRIFARCNQEYPPPTSQAKLR